MFDTIGRGVFCREIRLKDAFRHQNNFLVKIFFPLVAQENNALSRVPRTRELLFSNLLRDVPEKYVSPFDFTR